MQESHRVGGLIAAILVACFGVNRAAATTISPSIVIASAQLPPSNMPQVGALDIFFTNPGSDPIDVAGVQIQLEIMGPDDAVKFTGATAPVGRAYLFAPDSPAPLALLSPNGQQITIGDFLTAGFGHIVDGVGIATVQFLVEPQASGKTYNIVLNPDPAESFLGINASTFVPFSAQNGTISVVPEGQTSVLAVIGSTVFLAVRFGAHRDFRPQLLRSDGPWL